MAALVVAGAGVPVCKHGNRSASSKCGSADVLEAARRRDRAARRRRRCVRRAKRASASVSRRCSTRRSGSPARRGARSGIPTAFNLLGPMANPGRVRRQLIGVADPRFAEPMIATLARARSRPTPGWCTATASTSSPPPDRRRVLALADGDDRRVHGRPGRARAGSGDRRRPPSAAIPTENAVVVRRVLGGRDAGRTATSCVLNAGAGLVVGGARRRPRRRASTRRRRAIDDGRAQASARRARAGVAGRTPSERVASSSASRRRRPTSAPGSTCSAWRSTCTSTSGSAMFPTAPGRSIDTHPAATAFSAVNGRRPARTVVVAFLDPDGARAGLQRCGSCRRSGAGRRRCVGRSGRRPGCRSGCRALTGARDGRPLERHGDNAAASVFGGVVAWVDGRAIPLRVGPRLAAASVLVWIPDVTTSTDQLAREAARRR